MQGVLIEKISKNRSIVFKGNIGRDNLFEMLRGYNFRCRVVQHVAIQEVMQGEG